MSFCGTQTVVHHCQMFPLTPYFDYFNAANAVDHIRQGVALCFIGNLPVKNTSDLTVACSFNHLSHCMRADIASISHNGSEDSADFYCCSLPSHVHRQKWIGKMQVVINLY